MFDRKGSIRLPAGFIHLANIGNKYLFFLVEMVFHFGLKDGQTYIDHQDKQKRAAYSARHLGNKTEKRLIENKIPSPSLFSHDLLWGKSTDLFENLIDLQKAFNEKAK